MLGSYRRALNAGWTDNDFVELVGRLNDAVAAVDGHGFEITPLVCQPELAAHLGLEHHLWVKDDTGNVAGSHKARHLFGTMLHLAVSAANEGELVIASCGNAALAAAVVARAAERRLRVFIPTWANPAVVAKLEVLEATIEVKERRAGAAGDPTVAAMVDAIDRGAIPFSVQGPMTESALDGGRTLGWELAEQLALSRVRGRVEIFVQVGGGALAAATWRGLNDGIRERWLSVEPVLHTVQTEAVAPLNRAWRLLLSETDGDPEAALEAARHDPDAYMWPWEDVGSSAASGILDDLTYDWLPVIEAMLTSGGEAHVVTEEMIGTVNILARDLTGIEVDATGSSGAAALLDPTVMKRVNGDAVVLFTAGTLD